MRNARSCALFLALAAAGCGQAQAPAGAPTATATPDDPRVVKARELLASAQAAPLPTPDPPPSPTPRGWKPAPAPEFKVQEVEAVRLLEEATAADPRQPDAHEMLARVLEPAALRRHARETAAKGRRKQAAPAVPPDQGVDTAPARVTRAWRAAIEGAPSSHADRIEALIRFGTAVGDLDAVDWAHRERIRRAAEKDTEAPLTAYGDFLLQARKDPLAAAEQYRNALLWAPEDATLKAKVARIYLDLARDHLARNEYATAESRLAEAAKYAGPADSETGRQLAAYRARLAAIRR